MVGFMALLDVTVVNVAIPSMQAGLDTDTPTIQWVVSGYALAFGLTIAAELMGAQSGIVYLMMVARRSLNTQTILLGIIIIGIEAWLADRSLGVLTRRLTSWTERTR